MLLPIGGLNVRLMKLWNILEDNLSGQSKLTGIG